MTELALGRGEGWRRGDRGVPCQTDQPLPKQTLSPPKTNPTLETHCCWQWVPSFWWWWFGNPWCWLLHWPQGTSGDGEARVEARLVFGIAFFFTISFPIFFSPQHQLAIVLTRQKWPTLIPADFCELCKCLRERWDSREVPRRAGCQGLRNGRNAHMFSVCDTAADGNRLITRRDRFMLPLHQSLRCFPYLWLSVVC